MHHLSKWNPHFEDECELCLEDEESTVHLFYDCPALWLRRLDLLREVPMEDQIVGFFHDPVLQDLMGARGRA